MLKAAGEEGAIFSNGFDTGELGGKEKFRGKRRWTP